jgi:PPOX class probable F420-dependent enzyme
MLGDMDLAAALDFVRSRRQGVLTTIRSNGRPQLSNIVYDCDESGTVSISVTDGRAKTKNLRRDARASLYVVGDTFWAYVVLEGTAELTPVASQPDDPTVEGLVALYRRVNGEHPDWDEYRRTMIADGRLLIRITPERAYGIASRD